MNKLDIFMMNHDQSGIQYLILLPAVMKWATPNLPTIYKKILLWTNQLEQLTPLACLQHVERISCILFGSSFKKPNHCRADDFLKSGLKPKAVKEAGRPSSQVCVWCQSNGTHMCRLSADEPVTVCAACCAPPKTEHPVTTICWLPLHIT